MLKPDQLPIGLFSKDKKTNDNIQRHHFRKQVATQRNKLSELLHNFQPGFMEPEHEGDRTVKVTQDDILDAVNIQTAANAFELKLELGQYQCNFSRNGATLMLTSSQGHLALLDWREKELKLELNLREKIGKSTFLHNDEMFALSQPRQTYIYDGRGIQLHKLPFSQGLQYLPYHFLLVSHDNYKLRYYDTTTGYVVADHNAKNTYTTMRQNKGNAVIALGTAKGVVQWWTPGIGTPAVELFVGGKVDAIGFYKGYMYTAADKLKIWDTRMLRPMQEMALPRRVTSLEVSDSSLLALNYGFKTQIWKDLHLQNQKTPYMRLPTNGKYSVNNIKFAPFEDILGLGTSEGFSSAVVPGSGVPFYDSFQNNPFVTRKQQREALVHKLMQKLPPETITIDPNVLGSMSRLTKEQMEVEEKTEKERKQREHLQKVISKKKAKGGSKISKKISKKQIEMDKIKRAELTQVLNTKIWARRAQRKKREGQLSLIEQMQNEGLGVADLLAQQH